MCEHVGMWEEVVGGDVTFTGTWVRYSICHAHLFIFSVTSAQPEKSEPVASLAHSKRLAFSDSTHVPRTSTSPPAVVRP